MVKFTKSKIQDITPITSRDTHYHIQRKRSSSIIFHLEPFTRVLSMIIHLLFAPFFLSLYHFIY